MTDLTKSEGFLLDWLGKEDSSAYGECHGADLDRLRALGLVTWPVHPEGTADAAGGSLGGKPVRGFWERVRLTEAGIAALVARRAA